MMTEQQLALFKERLNHMLGMHSETPGYRNYYCCAQDDLTMNAMKVHGLVTLRVRSSDFFGGNAIWRATSAGRQLVGAPKLHGGGDD